MIKLLGRGVLVLGLACGWAGCGGQRATDSKAAVQQAIEQHLAGRPGLAADKMVLEVKDVRIQGDKAEAEVIFRTTTTPPAQMSFHYELHKEGGGWKVETGRPSTAGSAHPPSGEASQTDSLPPEGSSSLPQGHPPVESAPPQQEPPKK